MPASDFNNGLQDNSGFKKNVNFSAGDPSSLSTVFNETKIPSLSFGEKLVGITFNPANDDKVAKAKSLCAELANLLYADHKGTDATDLYDELYHHAIGEILNAQMNVVKVLTLKY